MDRDSDKGTNAFLDRMQDRSRRKRPHLDENPEDRDANDSSQTRPSKRRHEESSGPEEGNGNGRSSLNGIGMGVIPTRASQPYPGTSLTGAALYESSPLAISNALFASSRYRNFLLRHQIQQIQQNQQRMQLVLDALATSGFASYNPRFSARTKDLCATVTASPGSSSSLPPFVAINPSTLQFGRYSSPSSLSSDTGPPFTFAGPPITTVEDWSRRTPSLLSALTPQWLCDELQPVAGPLCSPAPAPPLHITIPRTEDVHMSCDDNFLSDFQIFLRKQIEFFVAQQKDIDSFTPSRRKEISVGQVGIRCRHCASLPSKELTKGAVYFPSTLRFVYQAAQNMATDHFAGKCKCLSPQMKRQLIDLKGKKDVSCRSHSGKKYWAEGAVARGIEETDRALRFHS